VRVESLLKMEGQWLKTLLVTLADDVEEEIGTVLVDGEIAEFIEHDWHRSSCLWNRSSCRSSRRSMSCVTSPVTVKKGTCRPYSIFRRRTSIEPSPASSLTSSDVFVLPVW